MFFTIHSVGVNGMALSDSGRIWQVCTPRNGRSYNLGLLKKSILTPSSPQQSALFEVR